jgi:hypothetical protein
MAIHLASDYRSLEEVKKMTFLSFGCSSIIDSALCQVYPLDRTPPSVLNLAAMSDSVSDLAIVKSYSKVFARLYTGTARVSTYMLPTKPASISAITLPQKHIYDYFAEKVKGTLVGVSSVDFPDGLEVSQAMLADHAARSFEASKARLYLDGIKSVKGLLSSDRYRTALSKTLSRRGNRNFLNRSLHKTFFPGFFGNVVELSVSDTTSAPRIPDELLVFILFSVKGDILYGNLFWGISSGGLIIRTSQRVTLSGLASTCLPVNPRYCTAHEEIVKFKTNSRRGDLSITNALSGVKRTASIAMKVRSVPIASLSSLPETCMESWGSIAQATNSLSLKLRDILTDEAWSLQKTNTKLVRFVL